MGLFDSIINVVANIATGGLYSIGKAVHKTVTTGSLEPILTQGFDLGMAATGNQLAVDLAGPRAGQAFNLAGAALGAAGASGVFAGTPEAGTAVAGQAGSIAPSASAPTVASTGAGLTPPPVDPFATAVEGGTTLSGAPIGAVEGAAAPAVHGVGGSTAGTLSVAPGFLQRQPIPPAPQVPSTLGSIRHPMLASTKLPPGTPAPSPGNVGGWWSRLPDWVKTTIAMTGAQGITGLGSGALQSLSMADRMELDRLINQQQQDQRELQNRRSAYAPRISFGTPRRGLLATPGRT